MIKKIKGIDFISIKAKLDEANKNKKVYNDLLKIEKKDNDKLSLSILMTGEVVGEVENTFSKLFTYRNHFEGRINFENEELEIFTSVPLHTHTEYSILDGANKISDLVKKYNYSGAITDHGAMYGVVDFYKKMSAAGKKAIIGFEAYTVSRLGEENKHHLIVLAKNDVGLKNCMKLCSIGQKNPGGKGVPRPLISYEDLTEYKEGLVILSGCIAGEIPTLISEGKDEEVENVIKFYKETFGEDYYFEIQRHASKDDIEKALSETSNHTTVDKVIDEFKIMDKKEFIDKYGKHVHRNVELFVAEELVNPRMIELGRKFGVKVVATTDAHYLNEEDSYMHEALLCNQTKTVMSNNDRFRFGGHGYHVHSCEEMETLFYDMPEVLINTLEIQDKCNVTIEFGNYKLPKFEIPDGYTEDTYLKKLAWEGFEERFGKNPEEKYVERMEFELEVIKNMGYQGYFLIVWDYVKYAKDNGIAVGPGRGSGAGSIVLYCLHITEQLDPMKYDLLFERFLNPDRISMPDIDLDFEYELREEVIEYCKRKYGFESVSKIITFGTMAAKAAVTDMARVLGYDAGFAKMISKMIPAEAKMTINKALNMSSDFQSLYESNKDVKEVVDLARKVEGLVRNTSVHA